MSALYPRAALDLDCYFVRGDCVVETPFAMRVKLVFLHHFHAAIFSAQLYKNVLFHGRELEQFKLDILCTVFDFVNISLHLVDFAVNASHLIFYAVGVVFRFT